jgi:hypothetical protein
MNGGGGWRSEKRRERSRRRSEGRMWAWECAKEWENTRGSMEEERAEQQREGAGGHRKDQDPDSQLFFSKIWKAWLVVGINYGEFYLSPRFGYLPPFTAIGTRAIPGHGCQ